MVSSRLFNRLFPATMRDWRGPKPLFRRRKLATLTSFNDNDGAQHFTEYVQRTGRMNNFTGELDGLYPSLTETEQAVVAATAFNIDIRPKVGEEWLVDRITGSHDEVAAKDIRLRWRDERPAVAIVLDMTDDTGLPIRPTEEMGMFPVWHDKTDKHDHSLGFEPLHITHDHYLQIQNASPWTNGKVFTAKWLRRRVR